MAQQMKPLMSFQMIIMIRILYISETRKTLVYQKHTTLQLQQLNTMCSVSCTMMFLYLRKTGLLIRDFILKTSNAGIVGLYGAMLIRQNGSFTGRGIVHSKLNTDNLRSDYTKVAGVDGLLMAIQREVCNDIGRFDERYTLQHYYDKDLSLKTYTAGYTNFVINIPFIHKGAETRSSLKIEEDLALRNEMKKLFLEQWKTCLPVDVRTKSERMRDWIKKFV